LNWFCPDQIYAQNVLPPDAPIARVRRFRKGPEAIFACHGREAAAMLCLLLKEARRLEGSRSHIYVFLP